MNITFPRIRHPLSREQFYTLLLAALIEQTGGELRINAQSLESLDDSIKIVIDWSSESQQAILRVGTDSLVVAEVRGAGWTQVTPTEQPSSRPDPAKHAVADETRIQDFLEKWWQKRRMQEWREQGASAVANMPEPETPKQ